MEHQLPPAIEPISSSECGNRPEYECVHTPDGKEAQHFYLAHIEFDDMGEMWSIGNLQHDQGKWQSQLATALATIDKAQDAARSEKEVVVIAYIHGWHNNSSPYDEKNKDLSGFKTVLQDLSKRYSRDFPDRPPILVGIFLSWRGQVLAANHISSYWNRRDAANRIGGAPLTEVIMRLMLEAKGVPVAADKCESTPGKPNSHFVVIGHSLGARALEHAIGQPMLSLILERQAQAQACIAAWNRAHPNDNPLSGVSFTAPADLIVFLNAANDAFEMKAIIEALKRSDIKVLRTDEAEDPDEANGAGGPFLISVTSDGDWATEKIMPVAQWLSLPALAFRKYDKNSCDEGQLCGHKQSFYYRHSAASIKEMRSHTVVDQDIHSKECRAAADSDEDWPYLVATVDGVDRCFRVMENETPRLSKNGKRYAPWNNTPAFVIGVPKTLIPSHTDIFQDGTEELLIVIANHFNAFLIPTRMSTPAKSAESR
ncbi:MAG TPA: hypothetical protein VFU49_11940 [Ktedonobacteraceae bacterium]|nr:hypothetical protein [Ktedonobacteraceae bacterium]